MTRYNPIPRDQNRVPVNSGISSVDGLTPVPMEVNPVSGRLLVDSIGGTGALATEVKLTDGTNVVNVLKSDGTAVGQNAELVAGTYLSVPFTTTTVQAVGTTDAGNYRWVSVHTLTQGTSSVINFQGSNDGTNWTAVSLVTALNTGTTTASQTTTNSARIDAGPLNYRYFRLNVTGISAGTTTGVIHFSTLPTTLPPTLVPVLQSGTWTVGSNSATGSAVPANGFYQSLLARTSSPTAATTGTLVGALGDVMGMIQVATGGLVTTPVPANASNVVIKAAPGRLCNVLITATGVTSMLIYDNATTNSGTIIGAIPASPTLGATYSFSMPAAAGITIAGSATNPAVTVSWV